MELSVSYTEAIDRLVREVKPVEARRLPLEECYSKVLAESFVSAGDVPPFDRSPYDGYALRAEDVETASGDSPVTLKVLEEVPAGGVPHFNVTPGTASKVLTGAPIPPGADTVIMFEKTKFTETQVTLSAPVKKGDNVILAGEDLKKGDLIARQGQRIDSGLLGTLAAQNAAEVSVYKRPLVGLISTGSELVDLGAERAPGQVYDSNRYTLMGALRELGCDTRSYGIAGDKLETIAALLEKALAECDAVVTTGGVSVGDYDLTPAAMESIGVRMLFRGCGIKPGMACAYGVKDGKMICGLSGNPASSITSFHIIARPAFRKLCGCESYMPEEITVTLADAFGKKSPSTRILRGVLDLSDGTAKIHLPKGQGNVILSSTIGCNVMAIVPPGSGKLPAGTVLKGILI